MTPIQFGFTMPIDQLQTMRRDTYVEDMRRSWCGGCLCAPTQEEVRRVASDRYITEEDDFSFVGTPQQVIEQMRGFIDLGVTTFMVDCGGFPNLTTLEMLVKEVIPSLRDDQV